MDEQRFRDLLKSKGLKVTSQRMLVLETMAGHPGEHMTAEDIYDLVRVQSPEIGLATVYRTIQVLLDLNIIDKVSFDDGFTRYELAMQMDDDSKHHHHHAICKGCGKVCAFEDDYLDTLEEALESSMGFTVVDHEVKLYGYCRECKKKFGK